MSVNVMLVDDSASIRFLARGALSTAGFAVIEASDGMEALEKLAEGTQTTSISVVFCDVHMPRMNGIEFVEALARREGGQSPPVVMLTTEGHPELVKKAKASGAKGWMLKPFKAEQLVVVARKIAGLGFAPAQPNRIRSVPHAGVDHVARQVTSRTVAPSFRGVVTRVALAVSSSVAPPSAMQALLPSPYRK